MGVFRARRLAALRSTILGVVHDFELTLDDIPVYQKYRLTDARG